MSPSFPQTTETTSDTDTYIVRHGQTVANIEQVMSGWLETPLTEEGENQASAAGSALAGTPIGQIVSSDLGRAQQTARLISEKTGGQEITLSPELREWHFGAFEGRPHNAMWRELLPYFGISVGEGFSMETATFWDFMSLLHERGMWEADVMDAIAALDPSGQSSTWAQYLLRLDRAVDLIHGKSDELEGTGRALVIVTHGAFIRNLLPILDPEGYRGEIIGNASITHLKRDNGAFRAHRVGVDPYEW